jgi:hypothetical protein|tara:strand:+ start:16 stop:222 length:207 start_codon:yes stop_codon:yes gene_type:complete
MMLKFSDLYEARDLELHDFSPEDKTWFLEELCSDYLSLQKNLADTKFDKRVLTLYKEVLVRLIKKYGH